MSFNSQNGFGRTFENRLGDYCVIITSTATNQGGEFSVIIYVIILIVNMLNIGIILLLIKSPCTPTLYLNNCDTVDFFSVFDSDDSLREETSHDLETPVLSEIILTVEEVQAVLETLDVTKATGPDNVPARLLKETAPVISTSLCTLFNKSLSQGALPEDWKIANIIPVYKKGEKEYAENYRPISIVSKVLERCVFYNIREQLYQVIKTSQHGFIRGK